jgi:GNAT superfamily N-acetyltransferase
VAEIVVRRIAEGDLETLNRELPLWNAGEYAHRLRAQDRLQMVQAIAWRAERPVGRGMVLFPEHEEYSASAERERCAEVRDVSVLEASRRRGVATALMRALEDEVRAAGHTRIGLSVSLAEEGEAARALYARLGYRHAHGPFVTSTNLEGDDGAFPVGAVLDYLIRDL